ncbi:MAG: putative glycosyltransferase, exosortase G system-associated [Lachnospiraceae bacterium]|nr:putative glycosyltransferase, exosortase G system-associated [Lachnospiraceae bacterium]
MTKLTSILCYWAAWVIIPLLVEVLPNIVYSIVLVWKKIRLKYKEKDLSEFKPVITLIVPVYNSAGTLYRCIQSIYESTYPTECIEVLLVDNGSKDNSFQEFQRAQLDFAHLGMWWMYSRQGKSKALNKAIFNSNGKYVINIDSDGILHKDALTNMVKRFENHPEIDCMTGVILTEPDLIDKTKSFWLRQFQKMEFVEYAQAFLAGRNYESQFHSIFTLSGAFSAFRKSILLKTYLYNTNTICEDTHLSFQIKDILKKDVLLCHDALFMVDPIESVNKFYTQRQRWQIGELEVSNMFMKNKMSNMFTGLFKNPSMRVLIQDHTFAFPRMIWYFALIAMGCMNYDFSNIIIAMGLIYGLYMLDAFMYYCNIVSFMEPFPDIRRYYARKIFYVLMLPLYNLFAFFVRFAGIINSIERKSTWKTKTLIEEAGEISETLAKDYRILPILRKVVKTLLEKPEDEECYTDNTSINST